MEPFENENQETEPILEHNLDAAIEATLQEPAVSPLAEMPEAPQWSPGPERPAATEGKEKKPSLSKNGKRWLAAVLAVVLVVGSCAVTAVSMNAVWQEKTDRMERTLNQKIADLQKMLTGQPETSGFVSNTGLPAGTLTPGQVYANCVNGVVAISNQGITKNIYGQISETASSGSGFIISEDGYVVSNHHVVEGATTLTVITYDGTEYPATLVGSDKANDIALLKVDATGLDPVPIGSSDELVVGDQVVAIGNPLGELTSTLTVGFISAKDRTINTDGTYINMMQTDAAINSGNSGGPLFNMKGEVVGITTAKYSGSSNSGATIEGIGFAIPIDDVIGMLNDLRTLGYVTGAYLGVSVRTMDASVAEVYSLPTGSYVESVDEGGSAQKAGIQPKDIIIAIGGYEVKSNSDLTRALRKFKAGDSAVVTVYRAGRQIDLTVVLDERPVPEEEPTEPAYVPEEEDLPVQGGMEDWFGFFSPFFDFGS